MKPPDKEPVFTKDSAIPGTRRESDNETRVTLRVFYLDSAL